MGAHLIQGYLIARPMLATALETWRTGHASADDGAAPQAPPEVVGRAR